MALAGSATDTATAVTANPPVVTATTTDTAPAQTASSESGDNTVICKRFPAPTGSRIGKRQICKTKWQWDQEKAENADVLDKVQRNPGRPAG